MPSQQRRRGSGESRVAPPNGARRRIHERRLLGRQFGGSTLSIAVYCTPMAASQSFI
jgi:hypothetical protein